MDLAHLKKSRGLKRIAMALAALLVVWALAWLLVPPLLKHEIELRGSQALGRQLTVGQVDFKPWSLELTLQDLTLASRDGHTPQLSIGRLYIDGELQSLFRLAPVVDALVVERPVLAVRRLDEGHYDIDDLIELATQPSSPDDKPRHFALYNLVLSGGAIDFDDEPVHARHELRDLSLSLPFLSNLESRREVKVLPRLAFVLNGSHFDSQASTTPFAPGRATEADFRIQHFDLGPYLAYLPANLPVRPRAAVLDADLKLSFHEQDPPVLSLSGRVTAHDVALAGSDEAPILAFPSLRLDISDLRPLERSLHLAALDWQGPDLALRRDAHGRLLGLGMPSTATRPDAGTSAPPWQVRVDALSVQGGRVDWQDDRPQAAAHMRLGDVGLKAADLSWPMQQAAQFSGGATLLATEGKGSALAGGRLQFEGKGTDQAASVSVRLQGVPLALADPYLKSVLRPDLAGRLSLVGGLGWRAPDLVLQIPELTVEDLSLRQAQQNLISWQLLRLGDLHLDLAHRRVSVAAASLQQPKIGVARDAQGHWMYEAWLQSAQGPAPGVTSASATEGPAWQVSLGHLDLRKGGVSWHDAATGGRPVALELEDVGLQLGSVGHSTEGFSSRPASLQWAARVGAGKAGLGHLAYKGQLTLAPLAAEGRLEASRLPLEALEPYFADILNIELLRADASFRGQVVYAQEAAGPRMHVQGDASLEDVRVNSVLAQIGADAGPPISDELLSWKALGLQGIDLALRPDSPLQLAVQETSLSDFYARVVISDSGRINLQGLLRSAAPGGGPVSASAQAPAGAAPSQAGASPVIRFGPVSLVQGHVSFSDHFIRPNYSADLTDLTGRLSAFSSDTSGPGGAQLADLELRGRAQGSGSLEITGQVNPLAHPLALNIQGKVHDIDLPPLSPYAVKYAGYGIERGKLSVNVAYKVQPNGQLEASNNIVLNQLSFGDPVEGSASHLPVKLAVALLADSHGVIDVDLPISGSLNDPDFRLAPIIGRLLLNLVAKAITAPFSLLAHAFGGHEAQPDRVPFPVGSAELQTPARQILGPVAQALKDRPALKLTVAGVVDPQVERDGYRQERLTQMLQAEKSREMAKAGQAAEARPPVLPEERPALLKAVYRRTDIPKPRNLLGLAKDLPDGEMENLLLTSIPVTDELLQALATQRGEAVRDYLAGQGVPEDRLFLGAAKLLGADARSQPGAALQLDAR